jgi:hypothetical protein
MEDWIIDDLWYWTDYTGNVPPPEEKEIPPKKKPDIGKCAMCEQQGPLYEISPYIGAPEPLYICWHCQKESAK